MFSFLRLDVACRDFRILPISLRVHWDCLTIDLDPYGEVGEVGSSTGNQEVKVSEGSERETVERFRPHRQCS